jgi:hypothetical protein
MTENQRQVLSLVVLIALVSFAILGNIFITVFLFEDGPAVGNGGYFVAIGLLVTQPCRYHQRIAHLLFCWLSAGENIKPRARIIAPVLTLWFEVTQMMFGVQQADFDMRLMIHGAKQR